MDSQQPTSFILAQKGTNAGPSSAACPTSHLFVLLHGGIELLRQVVGHVGHAGLLLVGSADAAFIFVGFLVVLFLGILAVTLAALQQHIKLSDKPSLFLPAQLSSQDSQLPGPRDSWKPSLWQETAKQTPVFVGCKHIAAFRGDCGRKVMRTEAGPVLGWDLMDTVVTQTYSKHGLCHVDLRSHYLFREKHIWDANAEPNN